MESDGKVVKMYEEKRFVQVDRFGIDLKRCGTDGGLYTHVAMLKQLEAAVDEDKMGEVSFDGIPSFLFI